jgi:hypothetical protein
MRMVMNNTVTRQQNRHTLLYLLFLSCICGYMTHIYCLPMYHNFYCTQFNRDIKSPHNLSGRRRPWYQYVCIKQLKNGWTDFHESCYGRSSIAHYSKLISFFSLHIWYYQRDRRSKSWGGTMTPSPMILSACTSCLIASSPAISVCMHPISRKCLDGFSRNLLWTLCHRRLFYTHTL